VITDKRIFWAAILILISSFFFMNWEQLLRLNSDNRMLRLITFGNDSSQNSRKIIFMSGLNAIYENWIFGQYMGDVIARKNTGTYIHNFLSIWRQFGIIPFIFISINIIYIYLKFYLHILKNKDWNNEEQFVFILSAYCLVLFLFARSFVFSEIWIIFSLLPTYFFKKNLVY
jgi:O-antigen ligase